MEGERRGGVRGLGVPAVDMSISDAQEREAVPGIIGTIFDWIVFCNLFQILFHCRFLHCIGCPRSHDNVQ